MEKNLGIPKSRFFNPEVLGQIRVGESYYISPSLCLYTDVNRKTLWLDLNLDFKKLSKKNSGMYNFMITRSKVGFLDDFKYMDLTLKFLNEILENFPTADEQGNPAPNYGILEKLNMISSNAKDNLTETQKNIINDLIIFLSNLRTLPLNKLLGENNYTLLLGELSPDEELANRVVTENIVFEKKDSTNLPKYFEDVIIDQKVKNSIYTALGIPSILSGDKPRTGGGILIDWGGTGKSMMKASLIAFFLSIGAEVKEKDQGDITSYVNAGPQLIKTWYRGGKMEGTDGEEEIDLVKAARKNKTPSILIIDEAEDFIREPAGNEKSPLGNVTGTLKRFIQDVEKGGVTGYVITLLIANIDKDDIHGPLRQGAERLKAIHIGPPKQDELWNKIFKFGFKNLKFENNFIDDNLFAELLIEFNAFVSHEKFSVSPRRFMGFCSDYYYNFGKNDSVASSDEEFFKKSKSLGTEKTWDIKFYDFVNHFIENVLKENLKDDSEKNSDKTIFSRFDDYLKKINMDHIFLSSAQLATQRVLNQGVFSLFDLMNEI
ncbi:MAG: AAA family ATPase, partial [Nanoarchaeales archaeon]|nr:AAA family ATPase [Nanoarchaeales archaeon]